MEHYIDLVDDIWQRIFLSFGSYRARLTQVSKRWRNIILNPKNWKTLDSVRIERAVFSGPNSVGLHRSRSLLDFVKLRLTALVDVNITLFIDADLETVLDTFLQIKTLRRFRLIHHFATKKENEGEEAPPKPISVPQCNDLVLLNLASSSVLCRETLSSIVAGTPNLEELYVEYAGDLDIFYPLKKLQRIYVDQYANIDELVKHMPQLKFVIKERKLSGFSFLPKPACELREIGTTIVVEETYMDSNDAQLVRKVKDLITPAHALHLCNMADHPYLDPEFFTFLVKELKLDINYEPGPVSEYRPTPSSSGWRLHNPLSSLMWNIKNLLERDSMISKEECLQRVKLFLELGADPNKLNFTNDEIPLVCVPKEEFIMLLIQYGIDIHKMTRDSTTDQEIPAYFHVFDALTEDSPRLLAEIIKRVDINKVFDGCTLLQKAVIHQRHSAIKMLHKAGAQWTREAIESSIFWTGEMFDHYLVTKGFDVKLLSPSAIFRALERGLLPELTDVVAAMPDEKDLLGWTPMHHAALAYMFKEPSPKIKFSNDKDGANDVSFQRWFENEQSFFGKKKEEPVTRFVGESNPSFDLPKQFGTTSSSSDPFGTTSSSGNPFGTTTASTPFGGNGTGGFGPATSGGFGFSGNSNNAGAFNSTTTERGFGSTPFGATSTSSNTFGTTTSSRSPFGATPVTFNRTTPTVSNFGGNSTGGFGFGGNNNNAATVNSTNTGGLFNNSNNGFGSNSGGLVHNFDADDDDGAFNNNTRDEQQPQQEDATEKESDDVKDLKRVWMCDLNAVLPLLNHCDINARTSYGETPLLLLVKSNSGGNTILHNASILLKHGANPNIPDNNDWTPLHAALYIGAWAVASELMAHGANINAQDRLGITPLMTLLLGFCHNRDLQFTDMEDECLKLMTRGVNFELVDKSFKRSLMHYVACIGSPNMAQFICNECPKLINMPDIEGFTPLHYAVMYCNRDMVEFLLKNGADPNAQTALLRLTPAMLCTHIRKEGFITSNSLGHFLATQNLFLLATSISTREDEKSLLLSKFQFIEPPWTQTPRKRCSERLTNTLWTPNINGILPMLVPVSDPHLKDINNSTLLHHLVPIAYQGEHVKVIDLIRAQKEFMPYWSVADDLGNVPIKMLLNLVSYGGFGGSSHIRPEQAMSLCKDHQIKIYNDDNDFSVLNMVLQKESLKELLNLIDFSKVPIQVRFTPPEQCHTLMDPLITSQSSPALINQVLIMQPQALNAQNAQGDTPLILATECLIRFTTTHGSILQQMDVLDLLLSKQGIDLNKQNNEGNTALHVASTLFHLGVIDAINGNMKDTILSLVPFCVAAFKLLEAGSRTDIKNKAGKTPLDYCPRLVEYFNQYNDLIKKTIEVARRTFTAARAQFLFGAK